MKLILKLKFQKNFKRLQITAIIIIILIQQQIILNKIKYQRNKHKFHKKAIKLKTILIFNHDYLIILH